MDMTEVRRRVMLSMGGSIFDKMLEVVASATVSDIAMDITFENVSLSDGTYVLLSNPPGNPENAALQSSQQILHFAWIFILGGNQQKKYLTTSRKTPYGNKNYDYWGDIVFTEDNGDLNVHLSKSSNAINFVPDFTYYLCRVK